MNYCSNCEKSTNTLIAIGLWQEIYTCEECLKKLHRYNCQYLSHIMQAYDMHNSFYCCNVNIGIKNRKLKVI